MKTKPTEWAVVVTFKKGSNVLFFIKASTQAQAIEEATRILSTVFNEPAVAIEVTERK